MGWIGLGQSLCLFIIGVVTTWSAWRNKKNSRIISDVHILVNSQMGITLQALAQVTAAKAAITNNDVDIDDANQAMTKYLDHVEKQARVDAQK